MHVEGDDLYALLQVDASASAAEIRAAFRRLALRHHPDRSPGSQARMVALNRAYALLRDPERRRQYDAWRAAAVHDPTASSRPAATAPSQRSATATVEPLWAGHLDGHADDWRQMFEEERLLWEQLLAARAPDAPGRAELEAELGRARAAQLELENALRVREGLAPLSAEGFERQRLAEQQRARPAGPAGCLWLLLAGGPLQALGPSMGGRAAGSTLSQGRLRDALWIGKHRAAAGQALSRARERRRGPPSASG